MVSDVSGWITRETREEEGKGVGASHKSKKVSSWHGVVQVQIPKTDLTMWGSIEVTAHGIVSQSRVYSDWVSLEGTDKIDFVYQDDGIR